MKREELPIRENWKTHAEEKGFMHHTMDGDQYWNEGVAYSFREDEIEELESTANSLQSMCLHAVDEITRDQRLIEKLSIPKMYWDYIRNSWKNADTSLYGRFDLAYFDDGAPPRLIEYNADIPNTLYETTAYQWEWLEEMIKQGHLPKDTDQSNTIYEEMVQHFKDIFHTGSHIHFACADNIEDYATTEYMGWLAADAGMVPHHVWIEDIGADDNDRFVDKDGYIIQSLFKLYPWEDMFLDDFGKGLPKSNVTFFEPPWKALLSNKGILPILWELFPDHPNLLPAYFENERGYIEGPSVTKPIFSKEGANVVIQGEDGMMKYKSNSEFDHHKKIRQGYAQNKSFAGKYPIIGAWMVHNDCEGISIREDDTVVTQSTAKFTPHIIV